MRSGASSVQQTFSIEAASALKQSHGLAKRRGHVRVTPLHVAATLLTATSSEEGDANNLFRKACLRSHPLQQNPHPLHFKALDLCFSVALNRLPSIPPSCCGSLLCSNPSFSNALIAALKRAQAHQRRGDVDQKQQQISDIQVELDQLMISILDDPTVSKVMSEAGFSSTSIKNNLEEDNSASNSNMTCLWKTTPELKPQDFSSQEEDLRLILEVLLGNRKRRSNAVVVGDSVSYTERLVVELMRRIEKGDVPEKLKSTQFVHLQLSADHLKFIFKSDVEKKLSGLRRTLSSLVSMGRKIVIIFLGDLKWTIDEETKDEYKAVDHVIAEVGRLQYEWNRSLNIKLLLMATASYQTYMRCQKRQPSLKVQWGLHAVLVPSGGLALSLHTSSDQHANPRRPLQKLEFKSLNSKDGHDSMILCSECTSNFEKESSTFMQPYMQHNHQEGVVVELRRKWNNLCHKLHHDKKNQFQNSLQLEGFTDFVLSKDRKRECCSDFWINSKRLREDNNLYNFNLSIFTKDKDNEDKGNPSSDLSEECTIDYELNSCAEAQTRAFGDSYEP